MFREEQTCVGVFVSNYDDKGTVWWDRADYDVDHIYEKKQQQHINTLTHAHQNTQVSLAKVWGPFSFKTDVHIASFSLTHKYCYLCDLCVNVG